MKKTQVTKFSHETISEGSSDYPHKFSIEFLSSERLTEDQLINIIRKGIENINRDTVTEQENPDTFSNGTDGIDFTGLPVSVRNLLIRGRICNDKELVKRYNADKGVNWYTELHSRKPLDVSHGLGRKNLSYVGAYMVKKGLCTKEEFANRYNRKFGITAKEFLNDIQNFINEIDGKH